MKTLYAFGTRWAVRSVATAIGVLFCLAPAMADQFYYSRMRGNGTTETGLFRWDDATGAQSQVGGDGVYLREPTDGNLVVLGLAATSTGTLYGFAVDDANIAGFMPSLNCSTTSSTTTNQSRLVTIDTNTATVTYVGPWLSGRLIVGAGFNGLGQLWALDCLGNAVVQIDPATGNTLGSSINMNAGGFMGLTADIEFVGSGWGIIGYGGHQFRLFDPTTGGISFVIVTAQNQGFDSHGINGLAFTSHLDARNGGAAASECRLNILDDDNADELGHVNDRFTTNPVAAVKDADQYTPPSLTFDAAVGDMTRANGPQLPNCVYDWGDVVVANGPRHRIVLNGPFLGAGQPDFEFEVRAGGDNGTIGLDTDGVVIPSTMTRGSTVPIQVRAGNVGPDTRLQGWIDWGRDGSFAQPGDQILTDATVTPGVNTFNVLVSPTAASGATSVRFRIANETGLGPNGLAETGEVEEYAVTLNGPGDLSVTVTDNSAVYRPGTNVTYTIVVSNAGPFQVNDATVVSGRPAGITTANWTCVGVNGGTCGPTSGTGNIGGSFPNPVARVTLPAGASVVYTHTMAVPAGFTGNLVKTAAVTAANATLTPDPNTANNSATDTDIPARADVIITKTAPPAVPPGGTVAYTLTVTNNGPDAATAVSVDDPAPAGLTFVSNAGACTTAFPCALGDLTAGATRTITATYRLASNYTTPDPIVNTATATNTTVDLDATNNSASASTTLGPPQSDLQMVKSVSPDAVTPGQTFTYTLQVKNSGPSDATNITVTDTLPPQTTFVSSFAGCTAVGQVVTCPTMPSMIAGANAMFDLAVQLNPSYSGDGADILNSATVASDTTDPALGNNANPAGAPPVGPAGADLTLVKTVSADVVVPGQTLTYNLLVSNQGPSTATDVVVIDPLPAAMTFVSSPEGCTAAGQLVTCPAIATLAPGEFTTFTLVARLDPSYTGNGTDLDNRATVQSPTNDPVPGNDTTPPVRPNLGVATADLTSAKIAIGNAISPGIVFTYRISVTNAGPSSAADVTVTDPLPAPLTFVSSPSGCTAAGQQVTCTRALVAPGTTATFDLLVRLDPAYTGDGSDLVNTASVTSTTPDATPGNDQPAPALPPPIRVGEADVTITKTGPYGVAPAGGEMTYTIVVANQGPNAAVDVVVSDPTPAGLTLLETADACTTLFPCALGTLTPGQVKTITARYAVDPSVTGVISNTATVTSTTPDPSPANDTATAQTPPPPIT
jgi:uncharacterized repeat protein (TIGR01451 family)